MYNIDSTVPAPQKADRRGEHVYPFRGMEVGQSFFVPEADTTIERLKEASKKAGQRQRKKFVVRPDVGGSRCWRVS